MSTWNLWVDGRDKIARENLKGYRISFSFEAFCGADIIISKLKSVISQDTLQDHLSAGAVMIQVKNSMDLPQSVIDQRLTESILRMNVYYTQAYQCGLLLTGTFENIRNKLYVDGKPSHLSWDGYVGALRAWNIRGGVVWPIIQRTELQQFIDNLGNKLFVGDPFVSSGQPKPRKKFKENKQKFVRGMTLTQKARIAVDGVSETDVRHLLINLDGISNTTVQAVAEYMKFLGLDVNMGNFVNLALSGKLVNVKGIGPKTNEKLLKQMGYE